IVSPVGGILGCRHKRRSASALHAGTQAQKRSRRCRGPSYRVLPVCARDGRPAGIGGDRDKALDWNPQMQLPTEIHNPSAWYGPEMARRPDWIELLSQTELSEIELVSRRLAQTDINWRSLSRDDFALPCLERRLSHFLRDVLDGRGFVLLRGLPVERWGRRLS